MHIPESDVALANRISSEPAENVERIKLQQHNSIEKHLECRALRFEEMTVSLADIAAPFAAANAQITRFRKFLVSMSYSMPANGHCIDPN